mmetsp:Transcript_27621/g.58780  ORF Transcript_27621/g.58780 Transcript_27621/m.58780 type:complete len:352 (-) Transcript_27621:212-1267(-)
MAETSTSSGRRRQLCEARRGKSGRLLLIGAASAVAAGAGIFARASASLASSPSSSSLPVPPASASLGFLRPRHEAFLPGAIRNFHQRNEEGASSTVFEEDKDDRAFVAALQAAGPSLEELSRQVVDEGKVLPDFGERSAAALRTAAKAAGVGTATAKAAEAAVDAALHGLFLRQVSRLSQQTFEDLVTVDRFGVEQEAQERFRQKAEGLLRPGSDWSYASEEQALLELLGRALSAKSSLLEERVKGALAHRAGIDAIAQLQERMERLALKLQQRRSNGLPWTVSTSYRIPNTPFQFIGRYDRGRADLELRFSPELGTTASKEGGGGGGGEDSGKLEVAGPAALGVSFDLPF